MTMVQRKETEEEKERKKVTELLMKILKELKNGNEKMKDVEDMLNRIWRYI